MSPGAGRACRRQRPRWRRWSARRQVSAVWRPAAFAAFLGGSERASLLDWGSMRGKPTQSTCGAFPLSSCRRRHLCGGGVSAAAAADDRVFQASLLGFSFWACLKALPCSARLHRASNGGSYPTAALAALSGCPLPVLLCRKTGPAKVRDTSAYLASLLHAGESCSSATPASAVLSTPARRACATAPAAKASSSASSLLFSPLFHGSLHLQARSCWSLRTTRQAQQH